MPNETTSWRIRKETLDRLKPLGNLGESYEDVVNRLIDEAHYDKLSVEQKLSFLKTELKKLMPLLSPEQRREVFILVDGEILKRDLELD